MTNNETSNQKQIDEITEAEASEGCCGGPALAGANACCVKDAVAKAAGESGCGCGPKATSTKRGCC